MKRNAKQKITQVTVPEIKYWKAFIRTRFSKITKYKKNVYRCTVDFRNKLQTQDKYFTFLLILVNTTFCFVLPMAL